jgi:isoaspartyl peptidase/L-asparaginase-like protein (Ntn-hydrolase superfamily)
MTFTCAPSTHLQVARHVMQYTQHTLLAGDSATAFAVQNGFPLTNLTTNSSLQIWQAWENNKCQPNYRQNVSPDPTTSCGPYLPITAPATETAAPAHKHKRHTRTPRPALGQSKPKPRRLLRPREHDTIAMVAMDQMVPTWPCPNLPLRYNRATVFVGCGCHRVAWRAALLPMD